MTHFCLSLKKLTGPANAEEKKNFFPEKKETHCPDFHNVHYITYTCLVRRETESYPNEPAALQ